MSGASPNGVPVWVPIVVGVIGVIGVVIGQLINTLRENKRWKNETEREEIRWRREAGERDSQRQHENRIEWRKIKIEIYSELLATTNNIESALSSVVLGFRLAKEIRSEDAHAIATEMDNLIKLSYRVRLTSGPALHEAVVDLRNALVAFSSAVRECSEDGISDEEKRIHIGNITDATFAFIEKASEELEGVTGKVSRVGGQAPGTET